MSRISIWFGVGCLVAGSAWGIAVQLGSTWFAQHPWVVWRLFDLAGFLFLLAIADGLYQWRSRKHRSEVSEAFERGRRASEERTVRIWQGVLEAFSNASLLVGQTGRVVASLSHGANGTLAESGLYASQSDSWGAIQREQCSIPFVTKGGQEECAPIRLELTSASENVHLPKTSFDLSLTWSDSFKQIPFQIQAYAPGNYVVDVVLLVSDKYSASVELRAEAYPQMIRQPMRASTGSGGYFQLARVAIPIEVSDGRGRGITKEVQLERGIHHSEQKNLDYEKGYDQGMAR